jgi:hypothetical protein
MAQAQGMRFWRFAARKPLIQPESPIGVSGFFIVFIRYLKNTQHQAS